ncbi:contractile injection system protein, VgrG/Pvc8 family, partial [Zoogloea sp.]|uniref:contractile injection system protein, VgrG/Pvc8 family n=1 Tax=Zoogloea sp. TaxID=49181 RepID=UPI0025D7FA61
ADTRIGEPLLLPGVDWSEFHFGIARHDPTRFDLAEPLQFVQRLLAEEGLVYRFEPDDAAPMGHTLVILADTVSAASCPEDDMSASGLGGPGIRFHRAGIIEDQDTLQALGGERALPTAVATATGWDYKAKRVVAASTPTRGGFGGEQAPWLEGFDHCGTYPFATRAQAERALEL